jgi:hypothetical protein
MSCLFALSLHIKTIRLPVDHVVVTTQLPVDHVIRWWVHLTTFPAISWCCRSQEICFLPQCALAVCIHFSLEKILEAESKEKHNDP